VGAQLLRAGVVVASSVLFILAGVSKGAREDDLVPEGSSGQGAPREVTEFSEAKAATVAMLERLRKQGGAGTETLRDVPARRAYSPYNAIRFHVDYEMLADMSGATSRLQRRVKEDILPVALSELGRRVGVKHPVQGNLRLTPFCSAVYKVPAGCSPSGSVGCEWYCATVSNSAQDSGSCGPMGARHKWEYFGPYETCDSALECVTHSGDNTGVPNADMILYVTMDASFCGIGGIIGAARPCLQDPLTNRPVAAYINFCPTELDKMNTASAIEATIHELVHALYFVTPELVEQFVDADGQALGSDAVLGTNAKGDTVLKTPRLLEEANALYGCANSSIVGVPLESSVSGGVQGSHWESSVVRGDIMLGSYSYVERLHFGPLSYAVMEDSGWYQPNWETVGLIQEGRDAGCDLFTSDCTVYKSRHPDSDLFCTTPEEFTCSPNRRSRDRCTRDVISGCLEPKASAFSNNGNTHCYDTVNEELPDAFQLFFFGSEYGAFSRCMEVQTGLEYRIAGSDNLFRSQMGPGDGSTTSPPPQCYKMACTSEGVLQITIRNVTLDCATGQLLDLGELHPDYTGGVLGPCPNNAEVCATLSCPSDCNANGRCVDGRCYCDIPWVGEDCGQLTCTPDSCGLMKHCEVNTGLCVAGPPPSTPAPAVTPSPSSPPSSSPKADIGSLPLESEVWLYELISTFVDVPENAYLEPDNLEYLRAAVAQYFHLPSTNVQVERFCRGELTILVVYPAEGQTEQQQFVKLVESSADSMLSAKTEGGAVSMETRWTSSVVKVEEARQRLMAGENELLGCDSSALRADCATAPLLFYILSIALAFALML